MAVCPAGQAPTTKTLAPAVAFLTAEAGAALLAEYFAIPETWAALLLFAATNSYTTAVLCAGEPPAWPSFTFSDILTILSGDVINGSASYAKLDTLMEIAAWYAFCTCSGNSTPTTQAVPAYPTGAPVYDPGGLIPSPTVPTCWEASQQTRLIPISATTLLIVPKVPSGFQADTLYQQLNPISFVGMRLTVNADGTTNGRAYMQLHWTNSTGGLIQNFNTALITPGNSSPWVYEAPPSGWAAMEPFVRNDTDAGSNNTVIAEIQMWCSGQATTVQAPCCPPDPSIVAMLTQVQSMLSTIYSSIPSNPSSYSHGTVHSGLSGNGSIALAGLALAVRIDITTDPTGLGRQLGDPTYLFDRGFIVPLAADGPIAGHNRLTFNPQIFQLPLLTESIGYSLHPGVVVSITELTRGP